MRHRLPADVLLLLTILFWSFNFTAVKYGLLHGFLPLVYATARFGGGSAVFSGYTYARERSLRIAKREIALVVGAAGVGIYLNQMCFVYSVDLANASTTALVFGTLPIFVALIAWATRTERLHARHWIAVGVSFAGVALVAGGAGGGLSGSVGGILLGLGAAATWAAYSGAIGPPLRRDSPPRRSAAHGAPAEFMLRSSKREGAGSPLRLAEVWKRGHIEPASGPAIRRTPSRSRSSRQASG